MIRGRIGRWNVCGWHRRARLRGGQHDAVRLRADGSRRGALPRVLSSAAGLVCYR